MSERVAKRRSLDSMVSGARVLAVGDWVRPDARYWTGDMVTGPRQETGTGIYIVSTPVQVTLHSDQCLQEKTPTMRFLKNK